MFGLNSLSFLRKLQEFGLHQVSAPHKYHIVDVYVACSTQPKFWLKFKVIIKLHQVCAPHTFHIINVDVTCTIKVWAKVLKLYFNCIKSVLPTHAI